MKTATAARAVSGGGQGVQRYAIGRAVSITPAAAKQARRNKTRRARFAREAAIEAFGYHAWINADPSWPRPQTEEPEVEVIGEESR